MKYLITVISLSILFSCVQDSPNIQQIENLQFFIDNKENPDVIEVERGLQYSVIKSGNPSGVQPSLDQVISAHFHGTLTNGEVFWSSLDTEPLEIELGGLIEGCQKLISLMREGDNPVNKTSRKSLKLLGTVGEPINPEAWMWYYKTVGNSKCPIVDTWWQTETGGILIAPQTGAIPLKPGSATKPFYGIKPVLVNKDGKEIKGPGEGRLCISQSWPGQMRTVYGDHQRFIDTYFSQFDGKYFTGDGCKRDKDGYYWITGRVDDVIIVSGHNLGTAEIESAFVAHPKVAEAAVVGYPHDIKGNGLYCYVTLNAGESETGDLERELKLWVRKQIGPLATPDLIHFTPGLPKTRSGKIMRRILRKIAANEHGQLGDTTTLADPGVVDSLVENRKNI